MFGRKHFLDKDVEDWHIECWAWLLRNGVQDKIEGFVKTDLVLPTPDFFSGTDKKGHERALHIFNQVRGLAGMSKWPVRLVEQADSPAALSDTAFVHFGDLGCAGTFRYDDENKGLITYDTALVKDSVNLIATFAHELGHYLNGSFQEAPPGGWDLIEPATDMTASFLGFGLFGANYACVDRQSYSVDGIPQLERGKFGYLTEAQWVFDIAIFCALTKTEIENAKPYLKSHLWTQLKKAGKYVEKHNIGLAVLSYT